MANDAKVVCKNVFKNCDRAAFTKAFTLKMDRVDKSI